MRIYTRSGDLAFKSSSFPDGQPHFKLETFEREFNEVTIETAIKSTNDLFTVGLAVQVLRSNGYSCVNLDIRYLMGARMDRAIDWSTPFTLSMVASILNSYGLSKVRILDAHSDVATKLIRNSVNVLPIEAVRQVLVTLNYPLVVCPDKGAYDRVFAITHKVGSHSPFVQCGKTRDMETGALSGFTIHDPSLIEPRRDVLILDDICDGGGTFVGLSKVLRAAGARKVNLFVTHGIFSKEFPLEGIDTVFTTDSYFSGEWSSTKLVVIPVSMKEL